MRSVFNSVFWADKLGWCWFVVREKYCNMTDKLWLKPINNQAGDERRVIFRQPNPMIVR